MAKPILVQNDEVLVIDLKEGGRHSAKIDKIKSKNGKKVKLDKGSDEFNEDGSHPSDPNKRLCKLTASQIHSLTSSLRDPHTATSIVLDYRMLAAFDKELSEV